MLSSQWSSDHTRKTKMCFCSFLGGEKCKYRPHSSDIQRAHLQHSAGCWEFRDVIKLVTRDSVYHFGQGYLHDPACSAKARKYDIFD